MDRRGFLVAAFGLAGCSRSSRSTDGAEGDDPPDAASPPTVRPTPTSEPVSAETELSVGDWFSGDRWGVRVDEVEARDSFVDSFAFSTPSGEVEVPDDRRLLVAWLRLRNVRQQPAEPMFRRFGFVHDGDLEVARDGYEHPDYPDGLDLDWTGLAEETPRYSTVSGERVDSGETVDRWVGALVPASFDVNEVAVGFGVERAGSEPIPALWTR